MAQFHHLVTGITLTDLASYSTDELLTELRRRDGDVYRKVSDVCEGIYAWLDCITAEWYDEETDPLDSRDTGMATIAKLWHEHGHMIRLQAFKSAFMNRVLYAQGEVRTEKCPKHKGHWWGCWGDCACVDECGNGTGWLPNEKPKV